MNGKKEFHKKRILFVCSGNACRSQIAEGWAHALGGDQIEAFSAGVEAHGMDPFAVTVMAEAGVDISRQRSKSLSVLPDFQFDYVVTLSERATQYIRSLSVPIPIVAVPCESPVRRSVGSVPSLSHYRRIRDEIYTDVYTLLGQILRKNRRPAIAFS
mgnify:CR=1 FL=1